MKNVTGPCDFKVGPGRRFRSDELKSGELLAIGIGMILTVDRKHNFFSCHFCVRMYDVFHIAGYFFCLKINPMGGFPMLLSKSNQKHFRYWFNSRKM